MCSDSVLLLKKGYGEWGHSPAKGSAGFYLCEGRRGEADRALTAGAAPAALGSGARRLPRTLLRQGSASGQRPDNSSPRGS